MKARSNRTHFMGTSNRS